MAGRGTATSLPPRVPDRRARRRAHASASGRAARLTVTLSKPASPNRVSTLLPKALRQPQRDGDVGRVGAGLDRAQRLARDSPPPWRVAPGRCRAPGARPWTPASCSYSCHPPLIMAQKRPRTASLADLTPGLFPEASAVAQPNRECVPTQPLAGERQLASRKSDALIRRPNGCDGR